MAEIQPQSAAEDALIHRDVSPESMQRILAQFLGKSRESSSSDSDDSPPEVHVNAQDSRQLRGDPFESMAAGEYVPPKYDPQIWATMMETSTRLNRAIRLFARNTVGLGWFVEPKAEYKDNQKNKDLAEEIAKQKEILEEICDDPNNEYPLSQLFYMMKVDEEATGNGYIEVVRDNAGKVCAIYHVPAISMRIRVVENKEQKTVTINGFVQIRGNQKRYFKNFGDKTVIDAETGKPHEGKTPLAIHKRASEILHFKIYNPTSSWYGAPRYVAAAPAITGNRLAGIRNVSFFENDAVPRMAVLVSGGKLTTESMQQLEDFFKGKQRGAANSHRIMVLQAEAAKVGFAQTAPTASLELQPLTVGVSDDASFQKYREMNDEEVRECFGISSIFFSAESSSKSTAQICREITNEQEFEPDRLEKEFIINRTLVRDILAGAGIKKPLVTLRFARMKLSDPMDMARIDQMYAQMGALTPNELRENMGRGRYPEDYRFADLPTQVAMAELSQKLGEAVKGENDWRREQELKDAKVQAEVQKITQPPQPAGGMPGMPGAAPGGPGGAPAPAADAPAPEQAPAEAAPESGAPEGSAPEGDEPESEDDKNRKALANAGIIADTAPGLVDDNKQKKSSEDEAASEKEHEVKKKPFFLPIGKDR